MRTVVTAGEKGADIDVFACAIAYAELLTLEGQESVAIIPGAFTSSITPTILAWNAPYDSIYTPGKNDGFVLVDISDPKHFASFVENEKINEVYDHRYGYQDYWEAKLGKGSHIEMVGSCGTLIWEEYKKRNKNAHVSSRSAKLLLASVVSNNLAMKSELTTDRDMLAYTELKAITGLDEGWVSDYYHEQEETLFSHFTEYVLADTKIVGTTHGEFVIAQIEVWDDGTILSEYSNTLEASMKQYEPAPWMVNISIVSGGYNYLFSTHEVAKKIIENSFGVTFTGNVAKTEKLLMRKYLVKVLQT